MWPSRAATDSGPTALIVEDEPALYLELRELLETLWPELLIVGHAMDGVDALGQIARHRPDIVFLDIQIPDPNGLEVARTLRDCCHIVFVTAFDAYAIEAFDNGAVDYSEVLIKKTLKELVAELDPEQFWQTHRSTVVNALEIASIEPNMSGQLTVRLKARRELLPVAESFVRRFRQM